MADQAHEWTDKRIEALERKFRKIYSTAEKEMRKKLEDYLKDYDKANMEWKESMGNGTATRDQYDKWLRGQATRKAYLVGMVNTLAEDAVRANERAYQMINEELPSVFAENANYAAYEVESGLGFDTHAFDLYDQDTIRQIMGMEDSDQIIKEVMSEGTPIPPMQSLRVNPETAKDVRWNRQKFNAALTQSILQGESIPNTAKRLAQVLNMDRNMAVRAARTGMTSAENQGRVSSYERAKEIGIDLEQQWMATLDERTRYSHRELDGQHVPVGGHFVVKSNGHKLRFPADPTAHPSEVWNCRCTLVAWLEGIEDEDPERWSRLPDGMTYDEWKSGKKVEKDRKKDAAKTVPKTEPNLKNVTGVKPKPWDDKPEDYYLPDGTRKRLSEIEKLGTYDEFEKYFASIGIRLTTDLKELSDERRDDVISAVQEQCQKIAVAIDAYKETFGPEALSKLTRIHLYDDELPNEAAYHFNMIGENDPWAGTIRFRQWGAGGRTIFHELAHAFQDSHAEPWEDAITYSERMVEQAHLDKSFTAYAGASADAYEAERFADAFGYGFAKGKPEGLEFIINVWKELRKPVRSNG